MSISSLRLKERMGLSAPAGCETERSEVEELGSVRPRVVAPDPEVDVAGGRRRFSASYKARIVREADCCIEPGEVGALLRREGLYSSNLASWRKQYRKAGEATLADDKRGRKVTTNPLTCEVERLRRDLDRTQKKLREAELIIEFQKNLCEILGISPTRVSSEEGN